MPRLSRSRIGRGAVAFTCMLVTAGAFTAAPADARRRPTNYVPPVSIDRTGTNDVTVLLNQFFAGVPNSSTISFPTGARYRIEGTLFLQNRSNLRFNGNQATFFATTDGSSTVPYLYNNAFHLWPRNRAHWLFANSSNITVSNLIIRGANPKAGPTNEAYVVAYEAQHGVEFSNTTGVIEGNTITDTYGDLVYVSGTTGVTIRSNRLERAGRQGVAVGSGQNVTIDSNSISNIGRSAIDLEPDVSSGSIRGVRITGNTIGVANGVFLAAYGRGRVDDVLVEGNKLVSEEMNILVRASDGSRRSNWTVNLNTTDVIFGSPVAPLRFTRVDGVKVSNNYQGIASTQSRLAMVTSESCAVVVGGNDFPIYDVYGARWTTAQGLIQSDGYEATAACATPA